MPDLWSVWGRASVTFTSSPSGWQTVSQLVAQEHNVGSGWLFGQTLLHTNVCTILLDLEKATPLLERQKWIMIKNKLLNACFCLDADPCLQYAFFIFNHTSCLKDLWKTQMSSFTSCYQHTSGSYTAITVVADCLKVSSVAVGVKRLIKDTLIMRRGQTLIHTFLLTLQWFSNLLNVSNPLATMCTCHFQLTHIQWLNISCVIYLVTYLFNWI